MKFWDTIKNELLSGHKLVLMYVVHSEGSSPGRRGFKMLVSDSGLLFGSIGGGFMEHKLVELCKKELLHKDFDPFLKRQIHRPNIEQDKSGMICSGEQTIVFYSLGEGDMSMLHELISSCKSGTCGVLILNEMGIKFNPGDSLPQKFEAEISESSTWQLKEDIGYFPQLHIIGGGHVSLALSRFAHELGFAILLYDDREGLNTMEENSYAECVLVSDYEKIGAVIPAGPNIYLVLMSFGFRTDKMILRQLLNHRVAYLGMMGSEAKVKTLFNELLDEGIGQAQLDGVHSPIGIPISSQTPEEIAISILAELIAVKNGIIEN